jgi:DNA-binding NarL/FixJ family response regulator
MRVILVGSDRARARLRALAADPLEIVAEFGSMSAARASDVDADALLVAPRDEDSDPDRDDAPAVEALTAREIQVLERLAEGLSNKAIGARLGISEQTVKFHVASIAGKLGAHNRTDAVRRGVRRGLVTL